MAETGAATKPANAGGPASCETCKKGKKKTQKEKVDEMTKNLGDKAKADVAKSPTLQRNLADLYDRGWRPVQVNGQFALENQTGSTNLSTRTITLGDGNDTLSLSHEVQHAVNGDSNAYPSVSGAGMTRDQYVSANVAARTAEESSAYRNEATMRSEILGNGGRDIGTPETFEGNAAGYTSRWQSSYGSIYDDIWAPFNAKYPPAAK